MSIKLSGAGFPARSTKKSFFVERAGEPVSEVQDVSYANSLQDWL
jgi:hypothetical protein